MSSNKNKNIQKMKPVLNLIAILTIINLASSTLASQISHCKTMTKVNGSDCCQTCLENYLLNRCHCFSEKEHIKFFLTMNHFVFMIGFILLPLAIIGGVFLKFKWDAIAKEQEDLRSKRLGNPIEFDEDKIYQLRDDKASKTETPSGPEIEMGEKKGNELEEGLADSAVTE